MYTSILARLFIWH